jgi:hypothetical protein
MIKSELAKWILIILAASIMLNVLVTTSINTSHAITEEYDRLVPRAAYYYECEISTDMTHFPIRDSVNLIELEGNDQFMSITEIVSDAGLTDGWDGTFMITSVSGLMYAVSGFDFDFEVWATEESSGVPVATEGYPGYDDEYVNPDLNTQKVWEFSYGYVPTLIIDIDDLWDGAICFKMIPASGFDWMHLMGPAHVEVTDADQWANYGWLGTPGQVPDVDTLGIDVLNITIYGIWGTPDAGEEEDDSSSSSSSSSSSPPGIDWWGIIWPFMVTYLPGVAGAITAVATIGTLIRSYVKKVKNFRNDVRPKSFLERLKAKFT